jgi:alkaline phosphatase
MENVDVGKALAKEMGFDFKSLNDRLFVEAESAFGAAGFSVALDKTDAANPVLVVSKGAASARLPLSKNIMAVNGKTIELEGLVVLADKLGKVYLPAQAVKLAQAELK